MSREPSGRGGQREGAGAVTHAVGNKLVDQQRRQADHRDEQQDLIDSKDRAFPVRTYQHPSSVLQQNCQPGGVYSAARRA